jgi:DNA repair protein RecO (recombination protein O)
MLTVDAWVLHARPWRETSQLVELLTDTQGRVGVVTRGNRGSRRGLALQPFAALRLALDGRGELRRVRQAETLGAPLLLAGRPLYAGLYLNELLMRLTWRDVPLPGVHALYGATLAALAAGAPLEATLRGFERRLLDELGYGLDLAGTIDGDPVRAEGHYLLEADAGLRECPSAGPGTWRGAMLLALETGRLDDAALLREAKHFMRLALAPHLGDAPLNSRRLFTPATLADTLNDPRSPR